MKRSCCGISHLIVLSILSIVLITGGCSSDGGGSGGAAPVDGTPSQIAIGVSAASLKTDNSDNITVSASVLNDDNVAIEGVTVNFSASGGALSSGSAETDVDGLAEVTFSAGLNDKSNRQVTIQAETAGLSPVQVPVQIIGTTITLTSLDSTSVTDGGDTDRLEILVSDAGGQPVYNANVSISVSETSTGNVSLSATSGVTDVTGIVTVEVSGVSTGTATVNVDAAGAKASIDYTVQAGSSAFGITNPTEDPSSLSTSNALTIAVNCPSLGSRNSVLFATTIGVFSGGGASGSAITVKAVGGKAQAVLTSSVAGIATIQVSDVDNASISDSMTVAIFAPPNQASQITLQASNTVVAPSTDILTNSIALFATVTNSTDQVVGGAPVLFTLNDPTGGGETVYPTIAYTDNAGVATATFASGSLSSDAQGVNVVAKVLGSSVTISDSLRIIIGGTAGSVVIGSSTKVSKAASDTAYNLAMSVLVSDANGNPIPNAQVSLSLWPRYYITGSSVTADDRVQWFNEDTNRNLTLDAGEDDNGDGELTPPSSAAGTIPATVTTDEFGVGTFTLTYLKDYAGYIVIDLTASTLVLGSETKSTYTSVLGWAVDDEPYLGPSPFNF